MAKSNVPKLSIGFFSTMAGSPWGGSEELWSKAAIDTAGRGIPVSASVHQWRPRNARIQRLIGSGVEVHERRSHFPLPDRIWRKATGRDGGILAAELSRFLDKTSPSLVVLSDGFILPPIELLELCKARRQPFVTVSHSNHHTWWADDREAERYRSALKAALRCYFVSKGNLSLLQNQIAFELRHADVIWSPVNVRYDASPSFPAYSEDGGLMLACVGRLHPPSKGQDVLIEALASPSWRHRNWKLNFYGDGNMKEGLRALINRFGLSEHVFFKGFADPEEIWATHHALVMPSRYEGLPLTIIEAMLCGRAVAATDVGGNAEVIVDDVTGFVTGAPTVANVTDLLERLWFRRKDLDRIGADAAQHIRRLAPRDPAKNFADAIIGLATP